jgi:hypothetical protein
MMSGVFNRLQGSLATLATGRENSERAIEELKEFFGTKSSAAAVRSALALARAVGSTSTDGRTVIVHDQNKDEDVRIIVAR